jgi:hypothetical protein
VSGQAVCQSLRLARHVFSSPVFMLVSCTKSSLSLVRTVPLYPSPYFYTRYVRERIQKFPDWPPGARTANGTVLCHWVQLYRYFVSQSNKFCCHNPLCCFSTSIYGYFCLFRYRVSPKTFGYTLVRNLVNSEAFHLSLPELLYSSLDRRWSSCRNSVINLIGR